MTQQDFNENILVQLAAIQKKLPNGELISMAKAMQEMKEDISELKITLLNPEAGVIVKVNKNTDRSLDHEQRIYELEEEFSSIDELVRFKQSTSKALWIIFTALVGIVLSLVMKSV